MQKNKDCEEVIQGFIKEGMPKKDIIKANSALVMSFVKRNIFTGIPQSELLAAGNRGLSTAIDQFWHKKQCFTELASFHIKNSIRALVEWYKREKEISDSYDDLGKFAEILSSFRMVVETPEQKRQRFKDIDNGVRQILVVDHENKRITACPIECGCHGNRLSVHKNQQKTDICLNKNTFNGNNVLPIITKKKKDET